MDNDKILAKLYALKEAPDKDTFIEDWIADTKIDIAKDSGQTIGLGDRTKVWRKWLQKMRKTDRLRANLLRAKGINNYIFLGEGFVVRTRETWSLPTLGAYRKDADAALDAITYAEKHYKKLVYGWDLWDLDAELKILKAKKKPQVVELCEGGPVVDGKTLYEITEMCHLGGLNYKIDPALGRKSPAYFWGQSGVSGLIYPID